MIHQHFAEQVQMTDEEQDRAIFSIFVSGLWLGALAAGLLMFGLGFWIGSA